MTQRYYSLDVFRGATVALMILVNNPGSWEHIYAPLDHALWHGCTPTDLVFPFFLFAAGNAMAFVMPGLQQAGNAVFLKKVIKRTLLIFLIGLLLNWSPFVMWQNDTLVFKPWEWTTIDGVVHGIRILGVLQRIALCYFFASLIVYFFKIKGACIFSIALLLTYWLLCYTLGSKGDPYSLSGFFGTHLDKAILGEAHMYHGEGIAFDPEGLASLLSPIVQVIAGYLAGQYILRKGKTYEMLSNLFIAGAVLVFAGFVWDMAFPVNKKIWTGSYVIYTTGLAVITLSILIFLIEFKNYKGSISSFFDVFGKNPLFIFVLSGLLPRLLGLIRINNGLSAAGKPVYLSPFGWFYENACKNISADLKIGSLFYALCMIAFYWLIVYLLDKKRIYIKV
ncbi:MAG TPA: heparan-alpha-glucosaminide N-acetyltransferase domain-containing protein [Panacibacter sp.]|nr:heparan-alpha-glucosaminide N-acetyltransferase domain-containing protein [Panacibacter sp.]